MLKINKKQELVFYLNKIPKKTVSVVKNAPKLQETHSSEEESEIEDIKVEKNASSLVSLLRYRGF